MAGFKIKSAGFSLMEVLIASAMLGFLTLVVMQLMKSHLHLSINSNVDADFAQLNSEILSNMVAPKNCNANFYGRPTGDNIPLVGNSGTTGVIEGIYSCKESYCDPGSGVLRFPAQSTSWSQADTKISSRLRVTSVKYSVGPTTTRALSNMQVAVTMQAKTATKIKNVTKTFNIPVVVEGSSILGCPKSSSSIHVLTDYRWVSSSFGSCTGGAGSWSYGAWGSCSGGSSNYSYGSWGMCSVTCGGGIQTRTSSCVPVTDSGSQSRTASLCNISTQGIQTRTVSCVNASGEIVADSLCIASKPAVTQSCTPSDTVCGTPTTSQSCTPSPSCSGPADTSQSCNLQSCGVDCVGSWSACTSGSQTFTITTSASGGGAACAYPNGATQSCGVACVGSWGACSNGSQTYTVTTPASGGGAVCPYANGVVQTCGTAGVCGSSNGQSFPSAPTSNLCSSGTASAVAGTGPWNWSCNSADGGTNANCSATFEPCAGAGNFAGFTVAKYNGNLGGIAGANAKCAAEFPGSRMANGGEIKCPPPNPGTGFAGAGGDFYWINDQPSSVVTDYSTGHCYSWTSSTYSSSNNPYGAAVTGASTFMSFSPTVWWAVKTCDVLARLPCTR